MCYYRRTIYKCNHVQWGLRSKTCSKQLAYENNQADEPCTEQWTHPLQTRRVAAECSECHARRTKTDNNLKEFKLRLRTLMRDLEGRTSKKPGKKTATTTTMENTNNNTMMQQPLLIEPLPVIPSKNLPTDAVKAGVASFPSTATAAAAAGSSTATDETPLGSVTKIAPGQSRSPALSTAGSASEQGDGEHDDSFVLVEEDLVRSEAAGDPLPCKAPTETTTPIANGNSSTPWLQDLTIVKDVSAIVPALYSPPPAAGAPVILLHEDGTIPKEFTEGHVPRSIDHESF